jgi:hypothetical protein
MVRTPAQALYPHLPSAERPERAQGGPRLSDAMWPALSREAKARDEDKARWEALEKARSKRIAEDLRALAASLREGHRR